MISPTGGRKEGHTDLPCASWPLCSLVKGLCKHFVQAFPIGFDCLIIDIFSYANDCVLTVGGGGQISEIKGTDLKEEISVLLTIL